MAKEALRILRAIFLALLIVLGIYLFSCLIYYVFTSERMFYAFVSILAVMVLASAIYEVQKD